MNDHLASTTQAAPFKVGAIYRQRNGALVRLHPPINPDWDGLAWARGIDGIEGCGHRHLSDGVDTYTRPNVPIGSRDLLPGELDEAGNPIAQLGDGWIAWEGGKCPVPKGSYGSVRWRSGGTDHGPIAAACWDHGGYGGDIVAYKLDQPAQAVAPSPLLNPVEPQRPALTWNQPTPFDAFKGYEVKSGGEPSCSYKQEGPLSRHPDLTPSSHQMPASHCLAVGSVNHG